MKQYLDLLEHIVKNGEEKDDRTGTGTRSVFGYQMRFNLQDGFPLVTTKKLHLKSIIYELIWFLSGDTNISFLQDNGVSIWNEWAGPDGDLGPVYGKQWRSWECRDGRSVDQISNLISNLKNSPHSRRHIISAWNVSDVENMALPPCHCLFQFYVSNNKLSCHLYQRSADVFLGVPFNIASYALLTHMIAHVCKFEVGDFVHSFGDCHIYMNCVEQVNEQISREPKKLPKLKMPNIKSVDDLSSLSLDDFVLDGYNPHPAITAEMAV